MWIEAINLKNYSDFKQMSIDFQSDKINIVVAENELNKELLAESIYQVLFDKNFKNHNLNNQLKSNSNLPVLSLDINLNQKQIRIIRDFNNSKVMVLEPPYSGLTTSNLFANSQNIIGQIITELNKEIFLKTAYVDQSKLNCLNVNFYRNIIMDYTANANKPLQLLNDTDLLFEKDLNSLISEYKAKILHYNVQLSNLQNIKLELKPLINDLLAVSEEIKKVEIIDQKQNFFILQKDLIEKKELYTQLEFIQNSIFNSKINWADIIIDNKVLKIIDDEVIKLNQQRSNCLNDVANLDNELNLTKSEYDNNINKFSNLQYANISETDIMEIATNTIVLKTLYNELSELQNQNNESLANNATGSLAPTFDSDFVLDVKNSLKANEAILKAAQNQILNLQQQEIQIQDKLNQNKKSVLIKFFPLIIIICGLVAIVSISYFLFQVIVNHVSYANVLLFPAVALLSLILLVITSIKLLKNKTNLKLRTELESELQSLYSSKEVINKKILLIDENQKKLSNSLVNIKNIGSKSNTNLLSPLIVSKQERIKDTINKITSILKSNKIEFQDITVQYLDELTENFKEFKLYHEVLNSSKDSINRANEERNLIVNTINSTNQRLAQIFSQFNIINLNSYEDAYATYKNRFEVITTWNDILDFHPEITLDDINNIESLCRNLNHKINDLQTKIDTIDSFNNSPKSEDSSQLSLADLKNKKEKLVHGINSRKQELDSKFNESKFSLNYYLNKYVHITQFTAAIKLAKEKVQLISKPDFKNWSSALNVELAYFCDKLPNLEHDLNIQNISFDSHLHVEITDTSGLKYSINDDKIRNLPIENLELIDFILRLAIFKNLTKNHSIPLILVEPFCNSDIGIFLKFIEFITRNLLLDYQIIIFSDRQDRYDWLKSNISRRGRNKLHVCKLEESITN